MYACPRNGELVECRVCQPLRVAPHRVESLTKGKCETHGIALVRKES